MSRIETPATPSLSDPVFIGKLEALYLLARKVLNGSLQADRKSSKKGAGIQFADYSEYSFGDDYRAIDWRVYARLESLMIKLFELEEDMTLYLVLDCSPSMASKFAYAKQLAAALGYIALNNLDRLVTVSLSDQLAVIQDPCHGRGKTLTFLRQLESAPLLGADTDFSACMRSLQARFRRKGMVVVLSDFLFPGGFADGLHFLRWHKHDCFCIQIQDDGDRRCDWKGDIDLTCVESGSHRRVTVSEREVARYRAALEAWNADLARRCAQLGIGLATPSTAVSFDVVIQHILRRGGLVA